MMHGQKKHYIRICSLQNKLFPVTGGSGGTLRKSYSQSLGPVIENSPI